MALGGQPRNDPQPGGREPAPGRLGLVQAFINSNYDLVHDHGAELLHSPEALDRWLSNRGLGSRKATEADLRRALVIREGLRDVLIAKHEGRKARLEEAIQIRVELSTSGAELKSAPNGLDLILALAAAAMLDGSWHRLKACKECSWAFYDHSRNGAGNWCSMKVCGGRVKQRKHYARTRSGQS